MISHNENMQTKPTMETLMERVNQLGDNLQNRLNSLQTDVTAIKSDVGSVKSDVIALRNEFQLFRGEMEIRIDRVEGMTNQTRAEMLNLRADFREWKDLLSASEA